MNRGGVARVQGLTLIELIIVIVIISLLAAFLATRLAYYQEFAEKVVMEQTVQAMRSGLQLKIAALMIQGKEREIRALAEGNPVEFLADPPPGYVGELPQPDSYKGLPGRSWYFDTNRRELVYLIDRERYFRPGADGEKWARFRVDVRYSNPPGTVASHGELSLATIAKTNGFEWVMQRPSDDDIPLLARRLLQ
jgi:prepilin-type N-terminal cleavage/methylation domain-containing protein